MVKLGIFN